MRLPRSRMIPAFWVTVMLMPLIYMATWAVLFREGFSTEIRAMALGAIFGSLLTGGIVGFWFVASDPNGRRRATDPPPPDEPGR